MKIRRLSWAGFEIEAADGTLAVIDLLEDSTPLEEHLGPPAEPLMPCTRPGEAAIAILTHLHRDHADAAAIARALRPGARLVRPPAMTGPRLATIGTTAAEHELGQHDLPTEVVETGGQTTEGPFTLTALQAVDGSGDTQHSWLIEADGQRVVHAGDTMWHGWWWSRAMTYGPVDAALLPANGPLLDFPHRQPPSGIPGVMPPEHAVAAAAAMQARVLVPMHYGLFDLPPAYRPVPDPEAKLTAEAERRGVPLRIMRPGDELDLATVEQAA
ncbi:MAG TPA: MBL fold metallo-hydrolase [Solirubrobacteraceae bacterium]|jgi:L-ascorbate metabolism protein UlaG (beta-lactamase superfamily)|nr:MBL fold metallo-hydrolase [Solirubrobacteraceae bacterium]